jgi:lipoprotein NlpD
MHLLSRTKKILAYFMLLNFLSACSFLIKDQSAPIEVAQVRLPRVVSAPSSSKDDENITQQTHLENSQIGKVNEHTPIAHVSVEQSDAYTVVAGDTLFRVAKNNGISLKDLKEWNTLASDSISVGQILYLKKPNQLTHESANTPDKKQGSSKVEDGDIKSSHESKNKNPTVVEQQNSFNNDAKLSWVWPTQGPLIRPFSASSKGIDIGGSKGQAIVAVAGGKVMYSGQGLKGYGKLIIIKHDKTYLSAYAHNQQLLVHEGQVIKQGQKIAEMGNSEAEQVKLHFEIRRYGKPVDPLTLIGSKLP